MSHLIRTRRAMTSTPSPMATPSPSTTLTIATTATAKIGRSIRLIHFVLQSHSHRHRRLLQWCCLLASDVLTGALVVQTRCRHRDP
ncbi:hypothetical protein C1H46_015508 [Malus baccata]|uniref:Uncharacterized protein n=1 Tax=Malus baccata TaxID=106549 RepID=A0A540MJA5_MALBA|nr:hypothetical protein C1H46_015508 [Malus baccata]